MLPGQFWVLHVATSRSNPMQLSPPSDGDGLSQILDLNLFPIPQLLEQVPNVVHPPHFPSTKESIIVTCY